MENATDALVMAGSVLLFIIALSVAISSLTTLRTETQAILNSRDQLLATTDENGKLINYLQSDNNNNTDAVRTVGIETVITSIRRMTKEDYTIYIIPKNTLDILPSKYNDLEIDIDNNQYCIKLSISGELNRYVSKQNLTSVLSLIHNKLKDAKFDEYIGIYQYKTAEGVLEAEKSTFKIITYKQR